MDIRYMEYILTLAKTGNITQAAKDLYISQPTLSQFIRNYQTTTGISRALHPDSRRGDVLQVRRADH